MYIALRLGYTAHFSGLPLSVCSCFDSFYLVFNFLFVAFPFFVLLRFFTFAYFALSRFYHLLPYDVSFWTYFTKTTAKLTCYHGLELPGWQRQSGGGISLSAGHRSGCRGSAGSHVRIRRSQTTLSSLLGTAFSLPRASVAFSLPRKGQVLWPSTAIMDPG